jgi:hypothetical protein
LKRKRCEEAEEESEVHDKLSRRDRAERCLQQSKENGNQRRMFLLKSVFLSIPKVKHLDSKKEEWCEEETSLLQLRERIQKDQKGSLNVVVESYLHAKRER